MKAAVRHWISGEEGTSAAEFGLVVPVMFLAVFAVFHLSSLVYAASNLHWTVEQSARCAAMSRLYPTAPVGDPSVSCQTKTSTQTYAASIYKGPKIVSSSFTPSEDNAKQCRKVQGSGTYQIRTGFVNLDVPISAQACFPTVVDPSSPWS